MCVHYPSSFLKLLLIGFAFAILPLLWAFINANVAFGKLAKQSEVTISQAVETTRLSRVLQEKSSLMERSARQYFVLRDEQLFNNYQQASEQFNVTVTRLLELSDDGAQKKHLNVLSQQSAQLHAAILDNKKEPIDDPAFITAFSLLTQKIDVVIEENNNAIDIASSQLTSTAKETQKNLLLQSLVLIPLALFVAGIITYLLARPIRRMDSAIRNLGEGQYDAPISIDGPGDLRVLGRRLDWLRTELKDLNAQKQQFLRHVSHELKTPLTAIREATELLRDGIGGTLSSQQTEIIQILRDNSVRLQKMIENLLNYTKVESKQPASNYQQLNVSELINKVLNAHALSVSNKTLSVTAHADGDDRLITNEEKLTIILDNLISNAVNYTPELGEIKINTSREKNWFIIEVMDNGPGFAKEDLDQLFDPFYRGNATRNGLINGSGLGLTIVKDLVETLDGNVQLTPSKHGAHFTVRLPNTNTKAMET